MADFPALHHVEHVMGMAVSFDIRPPLPSPVVMREAVAWLQHVDETFSTYRPNSAVCRLGRGELSLDQAGDDVRNVLRRCRELSELTEGAFDVFALPQRNGTSLDPSGYVKGWSIERVADLLEQDGCGNFCINASGDVLVRGAPGPGVAWHVGIRHPDDATALAAVLHLSGTWAVATSAAYERGTHIVDPRTSRPATGLVSATAVGRGLGDVDAWATACFVLGTDWARAIGAQPSTDTFVVTHDGRAVWSSGLDDLLASRRSGAGCQVCSGLRLGDPGLSESEEGSSGQRGDR